MRTRVRTIIPVTLLLGLSIVLSSCSAGQQVTAKEVVDKMRETIKSTQTSQGTIDLLVDINKQGIETLVQGMMPGMGGDSSKIDQGIASLPDTASVMLKVWRQSPDKARVEVEKSSIPDTSGAIVVYDGQKVYALDAAHGTVYTGTPDKLMQAKGGQMAAMMQGLDMEKELDKVLSAADITMAGTEKVGGLDAYKLEIAPKANAAELLDIPQQLRTHVGMLLKDGTATMWVDKDRSVPLKLVVKHPNIGQLTYTSNIELNKPIDPSQFVLQVPGGAKTVDLDSMHEKMSPKSMTIQEARDEVAKEGWKLLEPAYLPEKSTLVGVSRLPYTMMKDGPSGGAAYMLNYSSATADFSVTQAQSEMEKQLGDDFSGVNGRGTDAMKQVTVRGVEAMAFSPTGGNWTALMWKEKDSNTWVAIRGKLTLDEAVKIAEGLK